MKRLPLPILCLLVLGSVKAQTVNTQIYPSPEIEFAVDIAYPSGSYVLLGNNMLAPCTDNGCLTAAATQRLVATAMPVNYSDVAVGFYYNPGTSIDSFVVFDISSATPSWVTPVFPNVEWTIGADVYYSNDDNELVAVGYGYPAGSAKANAYYSRLETDGTLTDFNFYEDADTGYGFYFVRERTASNSVAAGFGAIGGWRFPILMGITPLGNIGWYQQYMSADYPQIDGPIAGFDAHLTGEMIAVGIDTPSNGYYCARFDATGNVLWVNTISGDADTTITPEDVILLDDGGFAVVGRLESSGRQGPYFAMYDDDGNLEWYHVIEEAGFEVRSHVNAVKGSGDIIAATGSINSGGGKFYLAEYDPDGNVSIAWFDAQGNTINAYPNPTAGPLQLNELPQETERLELYSLKGELVLSQQVTSANSLQLNIEALPAASYTLVCMDHGGRVLGSQQLLRQ